MHDQIAALTDLDTAVAEEAYTFGYPLVLMDATRQLATAVSSFNDNDHRPPHNQFSHMRTFAGSAFTGLARPDTDTLSSTAWLDLGPRPIVLGLPETSWRYHLMELLDAWTNVIAAPGTRTTANAKAELVIVGPRFDGELPAGARVVRSPTRIAWLIARTQTKGRDDNRAVRELQDEYRLVPLEVPDDGAVTDGGVTEITRVTRARLDARTSPAEQVARMEPGAFFGRLNTLMKDNPPAAADAVALARFAALGVAPGRLFEVDGIERARAVSQGVQQARRRIALEAKEPLGRLINGWDVARDLGRHGTDYASRAAAAMAGLGAHLAEDVLSPHATVDGAGRPLEGTSRYELTFPEELRPPVNAFWSLTIYNERQILVPNPLNRHALGDQSPLAVGKDGSLTLFIQHDWPGREREANWLPAPRGPFSLVLRLYWPRKEALEGGWQPPPIERVSGAGDRLS